MAELLDVRASELKSASTESFSSNHSQYIEDDDKVQTKMENLLKDPILRPLLDDLCQWLAKILSIDIHATNFTIPLQTGSDLCCLAEAISKKAGENGMKCPNLVFKKGAKPGSFQARCNMEAFVRWAKALGVRETCLFETVDLVELKFLRNVLICLLEVSKLADKYGVEPPELVKLEKTTKIGWQDLIKLSMKSEGTKQVMSVSDISETVNTLHKQATETNLNNPEGARATLMHHMAEDVMTVTRQLSVMKKWKQFVKKKAEAEADLIEITEDDIDDEPIIVEEEYISNVESQPFSLEGPRSEDEESLPDFQLEAEPELEESEDEDLVKLAFTVGTMEREADKTSLETDDNMVLVESEDLSDLDLSEVGLPEVDMSEVSEVELPEVEVSEVSEVESAPMVSVEEVSVVESSAPLVTPEETSPSDEDVKSALLESESESSLVSEEAVSMDLPEVEMSEVSELESAPMVSEEAVSMVESALSDDVVPGITVSADFIGKDREEMVPAAASAPLEEETASTTNSQGVQEPVEDASLDLMSTTNSQAGLVQDSGNSPTSCYTDVGWTMVLCFPAIRVNNDGTPLSGQQLERLELKRLKVLLLGIILVLIGSSMAIVCGVFGLQTTSVVEFQSGDTEEVEETKGSGLTAGWFYTLLVLALVFIIIGLSLITIWVCQTIKIRQLQNRTFVEKGTSYGTIRQ